MQKIYECKTKVQAADGSVKEYTVHKKYTLKKVPIADDIVMRIRQMKGEGKSTKAICDEFNLSYYKVKQVLI